MQGLAVGDFERLGEVDGRPKKSARARLEHTAGGDDALRRVRLGLVVEGDGPAGRKPIASTLQRSLNDAGTDDRRLQELGTAGLL